jgi:hypothetical protein
LSRSTSAKTCGTDAERRVHDAGQLRTLARRGEELLQVLIEELDEPPLRSCSQNEKPPCVPRPGIDGGMNANASLPAPRSQRGVEPIDDRLRVERRPFALVPRLQRHEVEAVVARR